MACLSFFYLASGCQDLILAMMVKEGGAIMDWTRIAEEKIAEAIRDGAFDQLPGKGKPLAWDDDASIPAELRASYRVLKNAGVLPEEMQLRKEMVTLQQLLASCVDDEEKAKWNRELTAKKLRYQSLMTSRGLPMSGAFAQYEERIQERLTKEHEREQDTENEEEV